MKFVCVLFIFIKASVAVIYDLNETEYERMPALFGLDDYRSCMLDADGVYCLARWDLYPGSNEELINLIREYSEHINKHYNHSYIQRGICVRKTCLKHLKDKNISKNKDLQLILEGCLNETVWRDYELEAKLSDIYYCNWAEEKIETDVSDFAMAAVIAAIIAVNIIGSYYDIQIRKRTNNPDNTEGNQYLLCFSIFRNWERLTCTKLAEPRLERLRGLHGIKSVGVFLIAVAHVMWIVGCGFTDNPRDFEKTSDHVHYQLIFNGMMMVQIFFVVSGCLLVYNLQMLSETVPVSWKLLPTTMLFRWCRLTPANAVMIGFTATWLRHLGSGPLWKMYVTSVVSDCRQYWWLHLIYLNNYVPEDRSCAVHSWHVSTDLQLFVVGVTAYIATRTRGKTLALMLLLLVGMVAPALHVYLYDLDGLVLLRPEFYRSFLNETFRYLHVLGHNNISSFTIGMATGYICYYVQKNNITCPKYKILRYLSWCVIPSIVCLLLTGNIFYRDEERASLPVRMLYAAVHRPILGMIVAFLILDMMMQFEDPLRKAFEWRGWMLPSRLSYSVYLLHVNFVHVLMGSRTQLAQVSFYHVIIYHLGVVSLSFIAAIPFYLLLEAPTTALCKVLLMGDHIAAQRKKIR